MSEIRTFLAHQLARGVWTLGQLRITPGIVLRHAEDSAAVGEIFERAEDARELAKYDDAGNYRPLKTAPNLRHGWELRLKSVEELQLALDLFYPAAVGTWLTFKRNDLAATPLRVTLSRQTGMYRVTQHIRDDQAEALIEKICAEGCLRCRLWSVNSIENRKSEIQNSEVLCAEACNLLVAACRPLAKENLPKSE